MRELPLAINNPERNIFVWRSGTEMEKDRVVVAWFLDDFVRRSLGLVDEIWVEDVELFVRSETAPNVRGGTKLPCILARPLGVGCPCCKWI